MPNIQLFAVTKKVNAILNLPGSKSIANRVLPLAAMAHGESIISNVPDVAEDVVLMLEALAALGIKLTKITKQDDLYPTYKIKGCSGNFPLKTATIFCGNSGTTIRFLTAILALSQGEYYLTGIKRMQERPIKDLVVALRELGANIHCLINEGYPPLQTDIFKDSGLAQISLSGQISSQYLTGLLMALAGLKRDIQVKIYDQLISKPYVEITLALLNKFGCEIDELDKNIYQVKATPLLHSVDYIIEPDASSASYFLAMGAINGDVTVNNLTANSLQGDRHFAKILGLMGANVYYLDNAIKVTQGALKAIDIDMQEMPDVAMTLAVVALFASGTTKISGISSWKVKETDRLLAMYNELTKVGASVVITQDSISITPPLVINAHVAIDTYNDHRMAMCFSLLAIGGVSVVINDYECVGKTFANYFDLFMQITK